MNFRNGLWNGFLNTNDLESLKADIYETDDREYIEIELPGFSKENIAIDYNNGYLTVSATKETEDKNYIRQERFVGEYSRSFYVGELHEANVKATYQDGILKLEIPKENPETTIRHIAID